MLIDPGKPRVAAPLALGGVAVRVAPEVLVTDPRRPGLVGALSFVLSKHDPLSVLGAEYATTLLLLYAQRHLSTQGEVAPRLIRVVDVFSGRSSAAPRATVRRARDVVLFCEEVAARWPSLH
jgi:hypothetical protein